ncbi:MAG: hypothetical protein EXS08_03160 [Planctomycetes bacterium]|nr:hypothetical protein [Planctomycetota bacterium]
MLAAVLLWVGLGAPGGDGLARLDSWVAHARDTPRWADFERLEELRAILGDLRVQRAVELEDPAAIDLGLVELAALGLAEPARGLLEAGAYLGRAELEAELARADSSLAARLAEAVLAPQAKRPRAERLLATQLLAKRFVPATLPALTHAAREDDAELARGAQEALSGWALPAVHVLFLEQLERDPGSARRVAQHFERTREALDPAVLELLERAVARRYFSSDWREAARARGLVRVLDAAHAVPILIEALATWDRRTRAGRGSKRIRAEIVQELQRISGRTIGAEAAHWSEWWTAVRDGRTALPAEILAAGGFVTRAEFFGLRAESDRVLFVVDRSGSMRRSIGTAGRTRHEEALEQLLSFLRQSGADTRFNVAVFGDEGKVWRTGLCAAGEENLHQVRRWLEAKEPEGWTLLFEGLRAGLGLDSKGRLDAAHCEADTVIVLCDGATTEGAAWVAKWLAEENGDAELVFHCVQIGDESNGTLEALAAGSGGELVRVKD